MHAHTFTLTSLSAGPAAFSAKHMWFVCVEAARPEIPSNKIYIFFDGRKIFFVSFCLPSFEYIFFCASTCSYPNAHKHTQQTDKSNFRSLSSFVGPSLTLFVAHTEHRRKISLHDGTSRTRNNENITHKRAMAQNEIHSEATTPPPPLLSHKNSSQSHCTAAIRDISAHLMVRPCQKVSQWSRIPQRARTTANLLGQLDRNMKKISAHHRKWNSVLQARWLDISATFLCDAVHSINGLSAARQLELDVRAELNRCIDWALRCLSAIV